MVVGEIAEPADFLVVGAGPGGFAAALRAAQRGREVVLVDRQGDEGLGGVCLHEGCIPSKALIGVAERAHAAKAGGVGGLRVDGATFEMAGFQTWKRSLVGRLAGGVGGLLERSQVRVLQGNLRFTRAQQAVVEHADGQATFLQFEHAVVATGSRPRPLAELPCDGRVVLSSADALALERLPSSLVVVGGGYIGLELGIAFAKLGTAVTLVEREERVLPTMEAALAKAVTRSLDRLGVRVRTSAAVADLDGGVALVRSGDAGPEERVDADAVVVAVGRRPNTDELGLEDIGVGVDRRGLVEVAADRRATARVAAIGDVTDGPALAHKAAAEARVAVDALCGDRVAFAPAAIPSVVFSDPEVASAGYSLDAARAAGLDADIATFRLSASGRAMMLNAEDGFAQLVIVRDTGTIVGAHLVGPRAGDLIAEGVLAIEMGATAEDLSLTVHPHPTLSEQYSEAAHIAVGHPLHLTGGGRRGLRAAADAGTAHTGSRTKGVGP